MTEEIDKEVIQNTQKLLGKYIKKPPLSEKLLNRPPFRFLHDVICSVIRTTGFLKGLYTEVEMISENVKERDAKIAFLKKLIDAVKTITKTDIKAKPSKIVSGLEAAETNYLLQAIGEALDKKLDSSVYITSLNQNHDNKKQKAKSSTSNENLKTKTNAPTKENKVKKNETDSTGNKPRSIKDNKSSTSDTKVSSRDKNKDSPVSKTTSKTKLVKTKNISPTKTTPQIQSSSSQEMVGQIVNKEPSLKKYEPEAILSERDVKNTPNEEELKNLKQENAEVLYVDKTDVSKEETIETTKVETKVYKEAKQELNPGEMQSQNFESSTSKLDLNIAKSALKKSKLEQNNSEGSSEMLLSSAKLSENHTKEYIGDIAEQVELNTASTVNVITPIELSKSVQPGEEERPKSIRPTTANTYRNKTKTATTRKEEEKLDRKPTQSPTFLRPPSVRPPSARPGAPRLRPDSALPLQEVVPLGKINVIVENFSTKEDEEETVVFQASPETEFDISSTMLDIPTEKGHLVEQILEQLQTEEMKENNSISNVDIEWQRDDFRGKNAITKEINQLRNSIQVLTRSANPLGKFMNFLHEDLEAMYNEYNMWVNVKKQIKKEILKQKRNNEEMTKPLGNKLLDLEENIKKQEDEIMLMKANILKNEIRIKDLLADEI